MVWEKSSVTTLEEVSIFLGAVLAPTSPGGISGSFACYFWLCKMDNFASLLLWSTKHEIYNVVKLGNNVLFIINTH